MGKGKAKETSRDDTNLSNTESRGETRNPEQDPVNIESEGESEASPISEAETTIMPTPGHAHSCNMQASSSVVQSGMLEKTFYRLLFHICGDSSLAELALCLVGA